MNFVDIGMADLDCPDFSFAFFSVLVGWTQILRQRKHKQVSEWLIGFINEHMLTFLDF